jgi:hypothetical protein
MTIASVQGTFVVVLVWLKDDIEKQNDKNVIVCFIAKYLLINHRPQFCYWRIFVNNFSDVSSNTAPHARLIQKIVGYG